MTDVRWLIVGAVCLGFLGLLVLATTEVRGPNYSSARRTTLQLVALGINNYVARSGGRLPDDLVDDDGRVLWSWRVQVLPDLEEQKLYDRLRLDEPWDSQHNRGLVTNKVAIFQTFPDDNLRPGDMVFLPIEGLLFGENRRFATLDDIQQGPGLSQMILLVEVIPEARPNWAEPRNLHIDRQDPKRWLKLRPGLGYLVVYADCSVGYLDPDIDSETLWRLLTLED